MEVVHALYQARLDEAARQELVRRTRIPNIARRTRDRLEMIRLSDAGWSVPRISQHLGHHGQTVRRWVKTYLEGGFDALLDQPHLGQQSAITPQMLAGVKEEIGKLDRTWTAPQVADWAAEKYGVRRSAKQWRKLLRRIGQSYKRTGRNLKHKQNPEAVQAAKREMAALEEQAQGGVVNCSISATSTSSGWR